MEDSNCWTLIDELEKPHLNLEDNDICFYYLVRTVGGYLASKANSRIENFKKSPEKYRDNPSVWKYKIEAIKEFADDVCDLLRRNDFQAVLNSYRNAVIVPIPSSKPKTHEFYDSRLCDMCTQIESSINGIIFKDVFDVSEEITPAHYGGPRNVSYLKNKIVFADLGKEPPEIVFLVDDVITTGNHFIACRDIIREHYPSILVIGIFLAIHRCGGTSYHVINSNVDSMH